MRCIWAAQILTDIAVVSYMHDTCALLQMPPEGVPGLADIVQQLLSTFAVMDQYLEVRLIVPHPPAMCFHMRQRFMCAADLAVI